MFKIKLYTQQVMVAVFTSTTQQHSCLRQHSTLTGKVYLPFSNQPPHFLPQPDFFCFCLPFSFDFEILSLMPFSTLDHTSEHCLP